MSKRQILNLSNSKNLLNLLNQSKPLARKSHLLHLSLADGMPPHLLRDKPTMIDLLVEALETGKLSGRSMRRLLKTTTTVGTLSLSSLLPAESLTLGMNPLQATGLWRTAETGRALSPLGLRLKVKPGQKFLVPLSTVDPFLLIKSAQPILSTMVMTTDPRSKLLAMPPSERLNFLSASLATSNSSRQLLSNSIPKLFTRHLYSANNPGVACPAPKSRRILPLQDL